MSDMKDDFIYDFPIDGIKKQFTESFLNLLEILGKIPDPELKFFK